MKNPTEPGKAAISEKLRDLIDELYVRMSGEGDNWKQAIFSYRHDGETVKFETNFTYDPPSRVADPKPWWKSWN